MGESHPRASWLAAGLFISNFEFVSVRGASFDIRISDYLSAMLVSMGIVVVAKDSAQGESKIRR